MNERKSTTQQLDVGILQQQLNTAFFGRKNRFVYVPIVDSTNRQAMQSARNGAEEGLVILTDSQTAGKGRQGRRWVDTFGCNALLSTVLRPLFPLHFLVMFASLAVVDAIDEVCAVPATIKWPNDILVGDRKVAGILIETSRDLHGKLVAIMGIGVNINNGLLQEVPNDHMERATLLSGATTLEAASGHRVSREAFLASLIRSIETFYLALQQEVGTPSAGMVGATTKPASQLVQERWRNQLSTLGRTIGVRQGNTLLSGVAKDVNECGELILCLDSGERVTITWGDIDYPTR